MKEAKFYTKRGLLTRCGFRCGYTETYRGLRMHMEHNVYHVRGFLYLNGMERHVMGNFAHLKEARKFVVHPFTHLPSRDGSVVVTEV